MPSTPSLPKTGEDTPVDARHKPAPDAEPVTRQPAWRSEPAKDASDQRQRKTDQDPQTASDQADQDSGEEAAERGNRFVLFNALPSWMTSMVVHIIILLVLALASFTVGGDKVRLLTIGHLKKDADQLEDFQEEDIPKVVIETTVSTDLVLTPDITEVADEPNISRANDLDAAAVRVELDPLGASAALKSDLLKEIGSYTGSGLDGRGKASRAAMVRKGGGSKASEAAVARALRWFAAHQDPRDGGWDFNHVAGPCQGRCANPGDLEATRNGATAMALLPFLGAGQTHKEGKYKKQVWAGLSYLVRKMQVSGNIGGLNDGGGRMYSHGLCAIALCEAYAMTKDKRLLAPAQLSLNFIAFAQDPVGGGWRYNPKEPGDTSVVGWQLMALKSGHMAYLEIDPRTIAGAVRFLDSVQVDGGAHYGYNIPVVGNDSRATTAIGLLCRMYTGWKQDHPALKRGVRYLDNLGPSPSNMYYNYYATQVMRHNGGAPWKRWNARMRDWLVNSQSRVGHQEGSWFMDPNLNTGGGHGASAGGRLYCTSMATMMLEVYYRHLPIYRKKAAEDEFPL